MSISTSNLLAFTRRHSTFLYAKPKFDRFNFTIQHAFTTIINSISIFARAELLSNCSYLVLSGPVQEHETDRDHGPIRSHVNPEHGKKGVFKARSPVETEVSSC